MLGLGVARVRRSPRGLFTAGEQGVWYDPSDFSTLFQDAAGTIPVTAVEQPVGLMLDKSKGLVLGAELVTNGDFSSGTTGWAAYNAVISVTGGVLKVDDSAGAGSNSSAVQQLTGLVAGKTYKLQFNVVSVVGAWSIGFASSATGTGITFPLLAKTATGANQLVFTYGGTHNFLFVEVDGNGVTEFDNISVRELPGNHASQSTATSRPVLKQDANGKYFLLFDGIDDGMVTASIDFSAGDKMTVFAGVRKLSDAAAGIVLESSVSSGVNAGAFAVIAPAGASDTYTFRARGSSDDLIVMAGYAAPITNVMTGIGDIPGNSCRARVNGGAFSESEANQGTGNFGNYPLYIGRRAGTTFPFNGHLYSLIVRGAQSTDAEIVAAETYVNSKTAAY